MSLGDIFILGGGHGSSSSILGVGHRFSSETLELHPEVQQSSHFPRQLWSGPLSSVLCGLCCRARLGKVYRTSLTETYTYLAVVKIHCKKCLGSNMNPSLGAIMI